MSKKKNQKSIERNQVLELSKSKNLKIFLKTLSALRQRIYLFVALLSAKQENHTAPLSALKLKILTFSNKKSKKLRVLFKKENF